LNNNEAKKKEKDLHSKSLLLMLSALFSLIKLRRQELKNKEYE
jgi:hypothetical protein